MESNGYAPARNGRLANGTNGTHLKKGSSDERNRPFSLDEALPYSPLSSVVPFNTDIIPLPTVGLRASTSLFSSRAQRAAARQGLDLLNDEATGPARTSERLEQTLRDLRQLLQLEGLTQFKFKTAPATTTFPLPNSQYDTKIGLTPFAKMVYDTTDVAFRALTPDTPGSRATFEEVRLQDSKQRSPKNSKSKNPKPSKHSNKIFNSHGHAKNSSIQVIVPQQRPSPPTSRLTTPPNVSPERSTPGRSIAIVLPRASDVIKPEDYAITVDSPTAAINLSAKKRRRSETLEDQEILRQGPDQREKADEAFRGLQEYLQDIFEAEDQFQSNGSTSDLFIITGDDIPSLSLTTQNKVDSLIQKIISLGRFSQVPVDDLVRLQKLCEGSMKAAEAVDVRIDDSLEESNVEEWLQRMLIVEMGLKSARTILRLMTGGREEKQLYSEEIIQGSLNAFKNTMDFCVTPIVELRSSGSSSELFKLLSARKKPILNVLTQCRRLLSLLKDLVASIEMSETVINTLEFAVSSLIFVENAHFEKESILGIQKFDSLRVVAMDTLAEIFASHPNQRQGIFDEILTSLEKLPVTKQSARQFKLIEGGSIQLVSALIMRLIQTSANKSDEGKELRRGKALDALGDTPDQEVNDLAIEKNAVPGMSNTHDTERRAVQQHVTAIQELQAVVSPLLESARSNASYVVGFIVNRAIRSTKAGESPYRNLLDLFVQDFITCLGSTDWPAAELLLRIFLITMVNLAEDKKTPAPAKNMALDLLGEMGAAISQLNSQVRKMAGSLDHIETETELGGHLTKLAEAFFEEKFRNEDLVSWTGPYRASLESLEERCSADSALQSAVGYLIADWASHVLATYDGISDDEPDHEETEEEYGRLAYRLRMMIKDKKWLSAEYRFKSVSTGHARLAYSLTLLTSQFCKGFERVLMILLKSMSSDQATVRSKSLKSINQVLETDPTILDRGKDVIKWILRCLDDNSIQVRDSALGLIGKCIGLRPALEGGIIPSILQRVNDSGIGVRKRAIKLLKDVYLRNKNKDTRSLIADALLHRVTDLDEGVQELARQTIEEVWIAPFYLSESEELSVQYRLALAEHVTLMVKTVQRSSGVSAVLDKVLQSMLSNQSKSMAANFQVCKTLVATMFDTIIDNSSAVLGEQVEARDALQLLMIFAKANAKLFTTDQIQLLQPYTANLKTNNDLAVFRSVVVIFRHVFPFLSSLHSGFLISVRTNLLQSVSRLNRLLLDDAVACLWIISGVLDSFEHLARLVASTLDGIQRINTKALQNQDQVEIRKLTKYLMIAGVFGKHCDLDGQVEIFKEKLPKWRGNLVSKLLVDMFAPFATPSQPLWLRKASLDALGMVCQSWPKNFSSANVYTTLQQAFEDGTTELEFVVMTSFKNFFISEEKRSEPDTEPVVGVGPDAVATLGVMGGSQQDGVATDIYQRFIKYITRIALASQDEHALLATEILVSINRQGLNHPKECGPTFVALETSENHEIADLAFRVHRSIHEKHETILEKENMRAVQSAFTYQHDVVKNCRGATESPFKSKLYLLLEVLNISKVKTRKRFYESLCARVDFDLAKLDAVPDPPPHLEFSRFISENMAYFEYSTIDELMTAITSMEKVVAGTGSIVAHAIETEVFSLRMVPISQPQLDGQEVPPVLEEPAVDPVRLRQLTTATMILTGLWEARTHLRRNFGLMHNRRESKGKTVGKDLNRPPVKALFATGDKFWEDITATMSALSSQEAMLAQCKSFVELLTVDKDFKIAAEGEDEATAGARLSTPSDQEGDDTSAPTSGRSRKRKATGTPGGRKKRARSQSRSRSKKGGRGSHDSGDEDDDGHWS